MIGSQIKSKLYRKLLAPTVRALFFRELIGKTNNFGSVTWLGHPIWQSILDLWNLCPQLLIECGTNRGGSSLFFAHLFDLMGQGEIITVDVERLHNLSHPRVTYLVGSSTSDEVMETIRRRAAECSPVMDILDSDHSRDH